MLLRHGKLETALIGRGLEGFQRRVEVELQPSGIAELDAVSVEDSRAALLWNCAAQRRPGGSFCHRPVARPQNWTQPRLSGGHPGHDAQQNEATERQIQTVPTR